MALISELSAVSSKVYSPWFERIPLLHRHWELDDMAGADDAGNAATGSTSPGSCARTGLDEATSVELVQRARAGDGPALERLIERYLPVLRRWATGRLPHAARDLVDTEDLIQDTLVKTLRNVGSFVPRHDGALSAYLREALSNRLKDEVRRVRNRPQRDPLRDDRAGGEPSPLEQALGAEALQRYESALGRLADEDRELVLARIEMGMTYEQVARAMNKPTPDAARMAVGRALVRLAREMDRE